MEGSEMTTGQAEAVVRREHAIANFFDKLAKLAEVGHHFLDEVAKAELAEQERERRRREERQAARARPR